MPAANYNLPKLIGTPPPDGFRVQGYDKSITDKAKVIEAMKDSFTHLRQAVINMPDADLEKQLDWFGGKNTERGILLFIMRHMAEHLGQSIPYAGVNGIVPPWAEEMQQQMKPQAKPKQQANEGGGTRRCVRRFECGRLSGSGSLGEEVAFALVQGLPH